MKENLLASIEEEIDGVLEDETDDWPFVSYWAGQCSKLTIEVRRLQQEMDNLLRGARCPTLPVRDCTECTDRVPPNCLWDNAFKARDWQVE